MLHEPLHELAQRAVELLAAQRAQVRGDLARVEGPDGAQPRAGAARRRAPRRRRRGRAPRVVVAVLRRGPRGGRVADAAAARAAAPRVVRAERAAVLAGVAGGRAGRRARRRARVVLLVLAGAGLRRHVRVFASPRSAGGVLQVSSRSAGRRPPGAASSRSAGRRPPGVASSRRRDALQQVPRLPSSSRR